MNEPAPVVYNWKWMSLSLIIDFELRQGTMLETGGRCWRQGDDAGDRGHSGDRRTVPETRDTVGGNMEIRQREKWIDIAKGLGLLFVLIGHSKLYVLPVVVYVFHMPLFFFLSGYVFSGSKYSFKEFAVKKAKRLLVPYYVLGVIVLLSNTLLNLYYVNFRMEYLMSFTKERELIISYFTQERFGTLWYISALFVMNIVLMAIIKLTKENIIASTIIIMALAISSYVYYAFGGGSVWFNIDIAFGMIPFFYFGYVAKRTRILDTKLLAEHKALSITAFAIISIIAGVVNFNYMGEKVDVFFNKYGIIPIMYIGSVAGTLMIVYIAKSVKKSKFLEYIGENSMLIYALHQATIYTLFEVIMYEHKKGWDRVYSLRVVESVACILLSLAIFGGLTVLIKKTKMAKIFGL